VKNVVVPDQFALTNTTGEKDCGNVDLAIKKDRYLKIKEKE